MYNLIKSNLIKSSLCAACYRNPDCAEFCFQLDRTQLQVDVGSLLYSLWFAIFLLLNRGIHGGGVLVATLGPLCLLGSNLHYIY